jgi:calpain-9
MHDKSFHYRLHGSYEALKYGTLLDGLADLTGGITESLPMKSDQFNIRPPVLLGLLDCTSIITCTINSNISNNNNNNSSSNNNNHNANSNHTTATGLNPGTNYRLCSLDKAETLMGDTVQLIRLRDPLADSSFGQTSGYNGDWSSYSNQWERVSLQERDRLLGQLDVGEFWMAFVDFISNFTHLECVHLDSDTSRDEPSLADKSRRWLMRLYQGSWKRGVSAGGCRNNPDTFHINPQLQLICNEREDVIISLNQHSVMEPKVIGFTLYSLTPNQSQPNKISECLPKMFFKKHKSLLNSQYTNSRQISQRCSLEAGRYLIMATTFEPAEESAFSVRVLGGSIRLSLLETQTMLLLDPFQTNGTGSGSISGSTYKLNQSNDDISSVTSGTAQYEPVFLQLADDHKCVLSPSPR